MSTAKQPRTCDIEGSSEPFCDDLFVSAEALNNYNKCWAGKPVTCERDWVIEDFKDKKYMWEREVVERGWQKLIKSRGNCHKNLMREFMANVSRIDRKKGHEKMVSTVRGYAVTISPKTFVELYSLKRVNAPQYDYNDTNKLDIGEVCKEILDKEDTWMGGNIEKKFLKKKYKPLHDFSCSNLLPQSSNASCHEQRAKLLFAIGTGLTIDMPRFMFLYLSDCYDGKKTIPYGVALSNKFANEMLTSYDNFDTSPPASEISAISMAKSDGQLKRKLVVVSNETSEETMQSVQSCESCQNQEARMAIMERDIKEIKELLQYVVRKMDD